MGRRLPISIVIGNLWLAVLRTVLCPVEIMGINSSRWVLWLSRGICGILCTAMRTLRFLCFASLFALIICLALHGYIGLADVAAPGGMSMQGEEKPCKAHEVRVLLFVTADQGGTGADIGASKPPTPGDLAGNATPENLREIEEPGALSSGTIMITMTGAVGDPGDIGQGK